MRLTRSQLSTFGVSPRYADDRQELIDVPAAAAAGVAWLAKLRFDRLFGVDPEAEPRDGSACLAVLEYATEEGIEIP